MRPCLKETRTTNWCIGGQTAFIAGHPGLAASFPPPLDTNRLGMFTKSKLGHAVQQGVTSTAPFSSWKLACRFFLLISIEPHRTPKPPRTGAVSWGLTTPHLGGGGGECPLPHCTWGGGVSPHCTALRVSHTWFKGGCICSGPAPHPAPMVLFSSRTSFRSIFWQ